ncbi:uncharacterized protein LOC124539625 [Vanessa cardui]|uniref:uncharacterized protein LOC124539625 n=1 Tax=Vanessa cardui TaxID=171605 RepID=UPI001F149575|nr:uncharacterized protein LOC124539625 [Vanessa cardui]
MLYLELSHVFVLTVLRLSICERRIIEGRQLNSEKRYMVYLTREKTSPRNYDSWLCGGAIVSSWYILTSAACVEDVQNMYAVAGYDKYVKDSELEINECTKNMKRRIVYTCLPEAYGLVYDQLEEWSKLDIALVKVDQKYKFRDRTYIQYCAYMPKRVSVNLDIKYEAAGEKAIVLGWGHLINWREIEDKTDYNQNTLRYAATKIFSKEECKSYFDNPNLSDLIDNYMICTYKPSDINEKGLVKKNRRKNINSSNDTIEITDKTVETDETKMLQDQDNITSRFRVFNATRRQGICQNDHGGPLISWVEGEEYVIGVASVFRVNSQSECIGPYLFTSTARNKMFINCVLNEKNYLRRSSICDKPAIERGFKIIERHVHIDEYGG